MSRTCCCCRCLSPLLLISAFALRLSFCSFVKLHVCKSRGVPDRCCIHTMRRVVQVLSWGPKLRLALGSGLISVIRCDHDMVAERLFLSCDNTYPRVSCSRYSQRWCQQRMLTPALRHSFGTGNSRTPRSPQIARARMSPTRSCLRRGCRRSSREGW